MMQDLHDAPPVEALRSIKGFLEENENRLCQEVSARDVGGRPTSPHDKKAISWCIEGLCYMLGLSHNMLIKYLHEAAEDLYGQDLVSANDELGYKGILHIIDEAIFAAETVEDAITMN